MSQIKVDHNKALKRNRKKIVRRRKQQHALTVFVCALVAAAAIGFIAYSGYGVYEKAHENDPLPKVACDLTAINDYITDISKEAKD